MLPDVDDPSDLAVFGIDSGMRHAVGGADYGRCAPAAFIGYRLLLERIGVADSAGAGDATSSTRAGSGYLANVTPSELRRRSRMRGTSLLDALPERLSGADFLARFDAITDTVTRVDPARDYAVRAATLHPVREHVRVAAVPSPADGLACTGRLGR